MEFFTSFANIGMFSTLFVSMIIIRCILYFLYDYFLGPLCNKMDFKAKGRWALVTGCTDGIGKEYAMQLAADGCDIVLVSRNMEKLTATAQEIESEYSVNTKIVQVDFSDGEHIYEIIKQAIADLEIGTLVNNVGVSYPYPEYYLDVPNIDALMTTMIKTNIISVVKMTGLVLPAMAKRKTGIIINIGSAASIIPSPLLTGYAATKMFVDKFSETLDMEYAKQGVLIQCIHPGFVCSKMSGISRSTIMAPTAKTFVKSALNTVGSHQKTPGYYPHTILVIAVNAMHLISNNICAWFLTRSMENTRRKAIKKYKRQ